MAGGKTKKERADQESAPIYTTEELLRSKTLGFSTDVVAAVLKDHQSYTREEAQALLSAFLCRKV